MKNKTFSIFHYTDTFGILCSIIENGFYYSYCKETLKGGANSIEYALLMVSFCDIPISKADNHKDKYGKFAIGLKKKWAIENEISPVQYFDEKSELASSAIESLKYQWSEIKKLQSNLAKKNQLKNHLINLLSYYKNYNGKVKKIENVCFYDEKEWRYIPKFSKKLDIKRLYASSNFNEMNKRYPKKPHIKDMPLTFKLSDITHIICPNKTQRDRFISCISSKSIFKDQKIFYDFLTKILTYRDLQNDLL